MVVHYIIVCAFFINFAVFGMEKQSIFPLEIVKYICLSEKNTSKISYKTQRDNFIEVNIFPWSLSPCLVKHAIHGQDFPDDLCNPKPNSEVLPNVQLWRETVGDVPGRQYRLSEDLKETNDFFGICVGNGYSTSIFDGLNGLGTMVLCHKYNSDITNQAFFKLYTCTQSLEAKKDVCHNEIKPILTKPGILRSLMLEKERNRIMYTVFLESHNELYLDDIDFENNNIMPVVFCATADLFLKTACLGKDTYFGITDKGELYSLWLYGTEIKLAKQHFVQPKEFLQLSVDNSVITHSGFHPNIAFLTKNGDIFVCCLIAYEQPTLLHVITIEEPCKVQRLFYRDGKLYILYQNKNKIYEYKDNLPAIEFIYAYILLKKHFCQIK